MKRKRIFFVATTSLMSLGLTAMAWGQIAIPVTNPNFEDDVLADGVREDWTTNGTPTGWTAGYTSATDIPAYTLFLEDTSSYAGLYNPGPAEDYGGSVPDGSNVAWAESFTGFRDGLQQLLTENLVATASYDLSVLVGNPDVSPGGVDYVVELLAGSTVVASATGAAPTAGTFTPVNLNYVAPAVGDPLVGQQMGIRLLSADGASNLEVHFDDLSLTRTLASPVSNPGGPYTVGASGSLELDGSGSVASDTNTLTAYSWDLNNDNVFDDVTGVSPAAITYADLQTTWGMSVGANTIQLRVTDATGTSTASGTVNLSLPIGGQLGVLDLDNANGGVNPATGQPWAVGDTYRLAFITSQTTDAQSTDISTYNSFVKSVAESSTAYPKLGNSLWNIVASTPEVDARDNTGTNPGEGTGVGIFLTDGTTKVADDNADLWNGNIDSAIGLDENVNPLVEDRVFTGSNTNGTALVASPDGNVALGETGTAGVRTGRSDRNNGGWFVNFNTAGVNPNSVYAMSSLLRVIDLTDSTAPTVTSITDDQSGGPVGVPDPVVYTVVFDEPMSDGTVDVSDFENATGTPVTIDSVVQTADPAVFEVTVGTTTAGTLELQIKTGADLKDLAGNALDTGLPITDDVVITIEQDLVAPTLLSINDDVAGGPIVATKFSTPVYTVTFDEPMNASTIGVEDFENGGSAGVSIDNVSPTGDPAVYEVVVTTSSPGDLILQVAAGAAIEDLAGNSLDAGTALPDDTTITVNPVPDLTGELGVLDVVNANGGINPATGLEWAQGDSYRLVFITSQTTDAQSADIATYNAFVQGVAAASSTYPDLGNGQWKVMASTVAVDARDNTGTNPGTDGTGVAMFLTDGFRKVADDNADLWNGNIDNAIDIDENGQSFVIPNLFTGGVFTGSFADGTSVGDTGGDVALGVDTTPASVSGVQTGTNFINNVNPQVPATDGRWFRVWKAVWDAQRSVYAMSNVLTVQGPGGGDAYDTWAGTFPGLSDSDPELDFDGGSLETGLEWVLGGDPTDASDDASIAPTLDNSDADFFKFSYRLTDEAAADGNTAIKVEYGSDLVGWTEAIDDATDVIITTTPDGAAPGVALVEVQLRRSALGVGGRIFARLNVEVTVAP